MSDGQEVDQMVFKARTIYTFPLLPGPTNLTRLRVENCFPPRGEMIWSAFTMTTISFKVISPSCKMQKKSHIVGNQDDG